MLLIVRHCCPQGCADSLILLVRQDKCTCTFHLIEHRKLVCAASVIDHDDVLKARLFQLGDIPCKRSRRIVCRNHDYTSVRHIPAPPSCIPDVRRGIHINAIISDAGCFCKCPAGKAACRLKPSLISLLSAALPSLSFHHSGSSEQLPAGKGLSRTRPRSGNLFLRFFRLSQSL